MFHNIGSWCYCYKKNISEYKLGCFVTGTTFTGEIEAGANLSNARFIDLPSPTKLG
jgi:hypothetical protein